MNNDFLGCASIELGQEMFDGKPHQVTVDLLEKGLQKLMKSGKITLQLAYLQNPLHVAEKPAEKAEKTEKAERPATPSEKSPEESKDKSEKIDKKASKDDENG